MEIIVVSASKLVSKFNIFHPDKHLSSLWYKLATAPGTGGPRSGSKVSTLKELTSAQRREQQQTLEQGRAVQLSVLGVQKKGHCWWLGHLFAVGIFCFQKFYPLPQRFLNGSIMYYIHAHMNAAATAAKSLQSCPTLCDPINSSPPGSPIPGILQARTLEWVAISFSNAWKRKVKVKSLSCVQLLATPWTTAYQAPPSMGFSRQEYWSGVPLPSPWIHMLLFYIHIQI